MSTSSSHADTIVILGNPSGFPIVHGYRGLAIGTPEAAPIVCKLFDGLLPLAVEDIRPCIMGAKIMVPANGKREIIFSVDEKFDTDNPSPDIDPQMEN